MIKGGCVGCKKRVLVLRKSLLTRQSRRALEALTSGSLIPLPRWVTVDSRPLKRKINSSEDFLLSREWPKLTRMMKELMRKLDRSD